MRAVLWLGAASPAGSRHGSTALPQLWLILHSVLLTQKVSPRFSLVGYSWQHLSTARRAGKGLHLLRYREEENH